MGRVGPKIDHNFVKNIFFDSMTAIWLVMIWVIALLDLVDGLTD